MRLKSLVQGLPHPVAIAGGHAVRLRVQKEWENSYGGDYFGSRDIDLAYLIDPDWTLAQLRQSAAALAPARIEDLHFKPHATFRYQLLLDARGEPLEREPPGSIEGVDIHRLFLDPMVTHIHPQLSEIWSFPPIDEPLLAKVFSNPSNASTTQELGENVLLPDTGTLVCTKLKSFPERTKDDKAVKDLCDLYALVTYGGVHHTEIRACVHENLDSVPPRVQFLLSSPFASEAIRHLDIDRTAFEAAIGPLAVAPRGKRTSNNVS